jgi:hypothetical protein
MRFPRSKELLTPLGVDHADEKETTLNAIRANLTIGVEGTEPTA